MTDALREALREAAVWLDLYAAEVEAGHAIPGTDEWDDPESAAAFEKLTNLSRTLREVQEPAPVVAREPTEAMEMAGARSLIDGNVKRLGSSCAHEAGLAWRAMYDAAPQAPVEPAPVLQPHSADEWDALIRERNRISGLHAEAQREIDHLRKAAAPSQLVEDARRYQFLRSFAGRPDAFPALPEPSASEEMDAAIDAAIRSIAKGVES